MKHNIDNIKQKGFTVAEMIIAIAVLSFGIILIYGAFFASFNATYSVGPRFTATYLANEGQEIIKNIRDNNILNSDSWSLGLVESSCSDGCQVDYKALIYSDIADYDDTFLTLNEDGFYSHQVGGTPTMFKRRILISEVGEDGDVLKVNVLVSWTYKGGVFSLNIDQYLYDQS
ncbi:MAG: prepilin-type N-terminal cleavage/methylation domain-containing protein [Candidatus Staskawiczbacteria bacterium]|nr:prepilin-type N-terminal cleavage/methylation domain-containing protein [Candidatus Staskawiczbacteria bacterium]